ncbi:PAS domain-containing sensor histidine kinase [Nostoc sp.]|uniref:PAS domain-containing sensor histidine kinase n=1 Tax=Nostoc sp. TaxID=1180 RepID=UPI002FF7FDC0
MSDFSNELHTQIQYSLIEKLSESERRYRELVDSLREIVFKCDRLGNLNFLNRAWTNTLGYAIADVIGSALGNFIDLDDRHLWSETLEKLQTGVEVCQELRFYHQTGVIVWLELSAQPQSETEFSGSMINISDVYNELRLRKHAEALLKQTNEELEARVEQRNIELIQANQDLKVTLEQLKYTQAQLVQTEKMSSLSQLVAGIAHEINNPVSFIYGNLKSADEYTQNLFSLLDIYQKHYPQSVKAIEELTNLIELDFLRSDFPKLFKSMLMGAERIRDIVLSLRTFSRLDEASMKAVDINEGIDSTIMIIQNRLNSTNQRLQIEVIKEYGSLPLVECYPGHLNQVFLNILVNALDALEDSALKGRWTTKKFNMMDNPRIYIRTQLMEPDQVTISIADNGLGIPEATLKQIFNPFFTTKPVGQGTGMGLAISYQIITQKHGGSLECISQLGVGAEFIIRIPLQQLMSNL